MNKTIPEPRDVPSRGSVSDSAEKDEDLLNSAAAPRSQYLAAEGESEQFLELQKRWSKAIIWWISGLIVFNVVLTVVSICWVLHSNEAAKNFFSLRWFVMSITLQTFLQIVGLAYIAVHYFFKRFG